MIAESRMRDMICGSGGSVKTKRRAKAGLSATVLALTLLCAPAPVLAQYRLAPGDVLNVSVLGAGELSGQAAVDIDGKIRLPVFGAVQAAGRDIEQVQDALRSAIEGRVFKRIAADGAATFVAVESNDVYANVAAYRPVYVTGAVGRGGGATPFRPGMTVRVALAASGGVGELTNEEDAQLRTPRLRGEERTLSHEIARLVVELWRTEAEMAEDADPAPPSAEGVPVRQDTFEAFIAAERARLAASVASLFERRAFFKAALSAAQERKEILEAQRRNQVAAAEFDAEEQQRVETLFQRGVVPVARLLDTRRAQLLSSTRLLDTDNNLERVELERVKFDGDAKIFEEERKRGLLDAAAQIRSRIEGASARLIAVREELTLVGAAVLELDAAQQTTTRVTIFRGSEAIAEVGPDFPLEPGDVVDVTVEIFDPTTPIR